MWVRQGGAFVPSTEQLIGGADGVMFVHLPLLLFVTASSSASKPVDVWSLSLPLHVVLLLCSLLCFSSVFLSAGWISHAGL